MWNTPFDISMLCGEGVIILCPEERLVSELMELLEQNGVIWSNCDILTESDSHWDEHKNETCYWVEGKSMSYGSREWAEEEVDEYINHTKCTFYGVDTPDFDTATDEELRSFLGA